ncbi:hypothetical protein Tco_1317947 [Tanacetum coccineum]
MERYHNLQIVLSVEDKLPFLEQPIPAIPVPAAGQVIPQDVHNSHTAWVKALKEIVGLMLMTMDSDIQKNLEHLGAYDMLKELKSYMHNRQTRNFFRPRGNCTCANTKKGSLMGKTVTELHAMLKLHEQTLPPKEVSPTLHAIIAGRIQKNQKKKSHKAVKGNQEKGKAKNGQCTSVEAIGEFHLCLPSGLVLILHNCHYAPSITRGIISVSRLYKDGFVNRFENDNSIFVSKNNLIYFNSIPQDDIYEIVMSSSNTNDSLMFAISNKRAKLNLDSALL